MGFDGELFVEELRNDLQASGRTLDQADWVKRTQQGEATKEDLVAWARQHYHGVTFHTRRWEGFSEPSYPAEVSKVAVSPSGRVSYLLHLEAKRNGKKCRSVMAQIEDLVPCKKVGGLGSRLRLID